jgi:hypothetical protein
VTAIRLVVPVLLGACAWVPLVRALRQGSRGRAAGWSAAWALALVVALPAIDAAVPDAGAILFPGAARYSGEMIEWVRTGAGCEGSPSCFLPQHGLHAAAFALATVATAGLAGLVLAAVLFGWMGAYAGALGAASGQPAVAAILCWHPWAVVRVAAYVSLGVALAEPLARRGLPTLPGRRRWLTVGIAGLILDVALKAVLAEPWRQLVVAPLVD